MLAARTFWPLEVFLIVVEALQSLALSLRLEPRTVAVLSVTVFAREILSFLAKDVEMVEYRLPETLR